MEQSEEIPHRSCFLEHVWRSLEKIVRHVSHICCSEADYRETEQSLINLCFCLGGERQYAVENHAMSRKGL